MHIFDNKTVVFYFFPYFWGNTFLQSNHLCYEIPASNLPSPAPCHNGFVMYCTANYAQHSAPTARHIHPSVTSGGFRLHGHIRYQPCKMNQQKKENSAKTHCPPLKKHVYTDCSYFFFNSIHTFPE